MLSDARRDDQLLLFYSGHGLLDERNQLYLAAHNTRTDRLRSTAVSAADISEMLEASAARTVVIMLDCCHSGAFKGNIGPANLAGSGRFVLTSCRSGELANDADRRNGTSLFTQHLVDGLRGGVLDLDGDGSVDVDEVYRYVHDRLTALHRQIPQRRFDGSARTPAIARRPLPVAVPPATAPPEEPAPTRPVDISTVALVSSQPLAVLENQKATPPEPSEPSPSPGRPSLPTWLRGLERRQLIVASVAIVALLVVATLVIIVVHGAGSPTAAPLPAGPAGLKSPQGMFVDASGDLYVADEQNNRVVRVTAADHAVTTVAGTDKGSSLFVEGLPATADVVDSPEAVSPLTGGGFYVVDHDPASGSSRMRILVVGGDGIMRTVRTEGALSASLSAISDIAADPRTGLLYVSTDAQVLQLNPTTGSLTAVAGNGEPGLAGDGGNATQAQLDGVNALALDPAGKTLYIADCKNGRVRAVDLGSNRITTVAGRSDSSYEGEGGRATDATLSCPRALAVGADGALYIIESDRFVRKVANEMITTVAGSAGVRQDGSPATQTAFTQLRGVAVDAQNRLYLSDGLSRVRLVDQKGIVSTYA